MKILITGAAGFIGYNLAKSLVNDPVEVIGIDNLNNYYDIKLKKDRLANLKSSNFHFEKLDLCNEKDLSFLFKNHKFDVVINLAAQAGVRNSHKNSKNYIQSNIVGFANLLEEANKQKCKNFIYASSSSVYGENAVQPSKIHQSVDCPASLYAATKKTNELLAHSYSSIYNLPVTGIRFFSVYGSWGRPDMAYFLFAKKIKNNESIYVFNEGNMKRDYTHISDVIEVLKKLLKKPATVNLKQKSDLQDHGTSNAPYRILNLGAGKPINLLKFIEIIELKLNKKAKKVFKPIQKGEVLSTYADITDLQNYLNYQPKINIDEGLDEFLKWFKNYHR